MINKLNPGRNINIIMYTYQIRFSAYRLKWDRGNAVKEISSMGFSISKEVLKVQKKYLEMIE